MPGETSLHGAPTITAKRTAAKPTSALITSGHSTVTTLPPIVKQVETRSRRRLEAALTASRRLPENKLIYIGAKINDVTAARFVYSDIGINSEIYKKLRKASEIMECIIMIRKTNKGSVIYFDTGTGVGKKLPTKGKSSAAFFTEGSIPFFASLAKKVGNWVIEQTNLIDVITLEKKKEINGEKVALYSYIPKLVPIDIDLTGMAVQDSRTNGKMVTVSSDNLGGVTTGVDYFLKEVVFNNVEGGVDTVGIINKQPVAQPYFLKDKADKKCYQVYIREECLRLQFACVPHSTHSGVEEAKSKPGEASDPYNYFWENEWKNQTIDTIKLGEKEPAGEKIKLKSINILNRLAPKLEITINGKTEVYRAVTVLALLTQGKEGASADVKKQYYEVVADYDNFMIAPSVRRLLFDGAVGGMVRSMETSSEDIDEKIWGENRSKIYIPLKYIPYSDPDSEVDGASAISDKRREKKTARYGITSEYELEVKKEMNNQLGINAVQHGCEVANLFYTSDIFEPIIFIDPVHDNIENNLFFMDLKTLFQITAFVPEEEEFDINVPIALNINWGAKCRRPGGYNRANEYAFIFNLNWGTTYYLKITNAGEKVEEINENFKKLIGSLYDLVITIPGKSAETEVQKADFFTFFNEKQYNTASFSIQALMLYMYQNWKIISGYDSRREATFIAALTSNQYQLFHYSFSKRLMYMYRYYEAVYKGAEQFAKLVHKGPIDVAEVRGNYVEAIKVIKIIAEKYNSKFFPATIQSVTHEKSIKKFVSAGQTVGSAAMNKKKLGENYFYAITNWISDMNKFIESAPFGSTLTPVH